MERFKNTLLRIVAVFAADGLKVIGAGAVVGIPVLKAVIVAGVTALVQRISDLEMTLDKVNSKVYWKDTSN